MGIPATWAFGQDMSEHNGVYDPSTRPVSFVKQRVAYADGRGVFLDARLEQLYQECSPVPLMGGWFFWSGFQSAQKQFEVYMDGVKGKRYSWHALDWEKNNFHGTLINPQTVESARGAYKWIEAVRDATGKKVLLYIQRSDYKILLGLEPRFSTVELWAKYWPYKSYLPNIDPKSIVPLFGGKQFTFWQYGGDAAGVTGYKEGHLWGVHSDSIDLDVFPGDISQLYAWSGDNAPPPQKNIEERVEDLEKRVTALEEAE